MMSQYTNNNNQLILNQVIIINNYWQAKFTFFKFEKQMPQQHL